MRRLRLGLLVPFIALVGIVGAPSAHAEATADACVDFEIEERDSSLEYTAKNSCERKLSCKMTWRVDCKTDKGVIQSAKKHSARFGLGKLGSSKILASAASCKESWRIEDVRWACD